MPTRTARLGGDPRQATANPTPDPPAGCFAILDVIETWQISELYIMATSDVPCHLTLRWTAIPPERHKYSTTRRGRSWYWDNKYCFVEWLEIEQLEDGDTLQHTFRWPNWYHCLTRWYYFCGTIAGELSRSNTAFFEYHFADPFSPIATQDWSIFTEPGPPFTIIVIEPWTT